MKERYQVHAACDLIRLWFRPGVEWGWGGEECQQKALEAGALNDRTLSLLVWC